MIQAPAQKKVPAVGLAIAKVTDAELETPEGVRRLMSQILENAPELFPKPLTFDVRKEGSALAYTLEAGGERRSGVHPHDSATRNFITDYLMSDLHDLRASLSAEPLAVKLVDNWREKLKPQLWRVVVQPTDAQFDDCWICCYEDKKR